MTITRSIAGILIIVLAGLSLSLSGCDKREDESEETEAAPDPAPAPEPEPAAATDTSSAAASDGDDKVAEYPEMTKMGGTVKLLKSFNVHQAADLSSKKLTGLAANTLVDLKGNYKDWVLIHWPSGPGELSPGWIHIRPTSRHVKRVVRPAQPPTPSDKKRVVVPTKKKTGPAFRFGIKKKK